MISLPRLAIVVPCYNEESVLPITIPIFLDVLNELVREQLVAQNSAIVLVDDGSQDTTWQIIVDLAKNNRQIMGLRQSRNRGHQSTVLAGLMECSETFDVTISIDADGQDDPNAMIEMMQAFHDGFDVVYGIRNDRQSDSFFKRFTAERFYKFLNAMGVEAHHNHADYRLMSSKVLKEFAHFEEVNLFLRGLVPLVGFNSTSVYYSRAKRMAGESHYPLGKMIHLAVDGITSLSVKPIRMISGLGALFALSAFVLMLWSIGTQLWGSTVPGWASTVSIVAFMGGVQLLSLGVIGEYVGKIYLETKRRPRYIISERTQSTE
ncbi:glycosyltransferase family 2 protein [Actinomyces sp. HMSC065F11]|uniref:glycosyltransferase family 2 protein n=1 Tax=Actinomyces sp. HMSC065F11 TaxID=1739395 RepID=UPI0008A2AE28|nr:glycosyltransferase family 2 protein [Actinomyces sp. HMSC065F11]OFR31186.1 ribonuclease III [Actinomyces sp. HMSC065F11]